VSSAVYIPALARELAQGQELATAWRLTSNVDGNAAAGAGDAARGEHASTERNIHPGEHSAAKRAVLCVVVSAQQARGHSAGNVQALGRYATADKTEGGSVLSKQGAVQVVC
jgi:hypothetical protein